MYQGWGFGKTNNGLENPITGTYNGNILSRLKPAGAKWPRW